MAQQQLRGAQLRKHITEGIKRLAAESGGIYTYNASRLSQAIGVSRPTLAKYSELIDDVLKGIAASKRMARGEGVIQLMQEKIQRLESANEVMKEELDVLRNHHAQLYLVVYHHAASLEPLIRPVLQEETIEGGKCILCHHPIHEIFPDTEVAPLGGKVIKLRSTKNPKQASPGDLC